jgi:hypothetical protein
MTSRRSRSPPVPAGFPRLPPPGRREGWPVSVWGQCDRVGVGCGHERHDRVADNRHVERELDVPERAEVPGKLGDLDTRVIRHRDEGDRVRKLGSKCSSRRSARCPRSAATVSLSSDNECASHTVVHAERTGAQLSRIVRTPGGVIIHRVAFEHEPDSDAKLHEGLHTPRHVRRRASWPERESADVRRFCRAL